MNTLRFADMKIFATGDMNRKKLLSTFEAASYFKMLYCIFEIGISKYDLA